MKKIAFFITIFSLVATNAFAFGFGRKHGDAMEKLDLSKEQKTMISDIHYDYFKKIREQRNSVHDSQYELNKELLKPNSNKGKLEAINRKLNEAHSRMSDLNLEQVLKVKEQLTPEQLEKAGDWLLTMHTRKQGMKKGWKGGEKKQRYQASCEKGSRRCSEMRN